MRSDSVRGRLLFPVPWIIEVPAFTLLVAPATEWFFRMTQDITILLFGAVADLLSLYVLVLYWVCTDVQEQDISGLVVRARAVYGRHRPRALPRGPGDESCGPGERGVTFR